MSFECSGIAPLLLYKVRNSTNGTKAHSGEGVAVAFQFEKELPFPSSRLSHPFVHPQALCQILWKLTAQCIFHFFKLFLSYSRQQALQGFR